MVEIKSELKKLLKISTQKSKLISTDFSIEVPKNSDFGDLSTNLAIKLAPKNKISPQEIAELIIKNIPKNDLIEKPEFLAGFINFRITKNLLIDRLQEILERKNQFGQENIGKSQKALVEFVSANPTGELHIGNARGGPIGQTVANLLHNFGYLVEREYYVNDFGVQVNKLASTLQYYYKRQTDEKLEMTEDMYPGEYIQEVFKEIFKSNKNRIHNSTSDQQIAFFAKEGLRLLLKKIADQLEYLGIKYESWIYESDILCSKKTDRAVNLLSEKGFVSNKEGALWFKSPTDPEMLDRETVLRKSDAESSFTYFSNDIAYHLDKYERGFVKAYDVWGANHFGHIPRLSAAMRALGVPDDFLTVILYQNVRLKEGGEIAQMSKRKGNMITVDDLRQEGIEADVFKFMILMHDANSLLDFDLKLAKDTSEKNPVYYVKYAHARICTLLKKAGVLGEFTGSKGELGETTKGNLLTELSDQTEIQVDKGKETQNSKIAKELQKYLKAFNPQEKEELVLAKTLIKYPSLLLETLTDLELQRLPHYAIKLATQFHAFYDKCRIIGQKKELENSRLALCLATKIVLKNLLNILSIEAPEKM